MHTPLTSTAGRHAADRQRTAEAKALADRHSDARDALRRALLARNIRVFEKFGEDDPALFARCGVDTCARDQQLIDATLDDLGWSPDCLRLSRFQDRYETLRLAHTSGARLTLTISRPAALVRQWEAA